MFRTIAAIALCVASNSADAQGNWPTQPIKLIVPYAAGASGDIAARKLAPIIGNNVGGSVIVENRSGANGKIAMDAVANSASEGHTFLFGSDVQFAILPALNILPADAEKAFSVVGPVMRVEVALLVNPKLGVNTVPELLALAKSKPGQISFGSVGVGSTHHLAVEVMKMRAGMDMTHVPYKGTGQALPDLISGEIQLMFMGIPQALPLIQNGPLKAIAVGSAERLSQIPNVPTLAEAGFPGLEVNNYWGVWAPASLAEIAKDKMRLALQDALKRQEIQAWFRDGNVSAINGGAEALTSMLRADRIKWSDVISKNKIVVQD